MKIKNLTLGLMVIGSLSMVGCDDIQDANSALEETTKKVEEKAEPEKKKLRKRRKLKMDNAMIVVNIIQ